MTKVGEEGFVPREQTIEHYHKELDRSISKFHKAFLSYHNTSDPKEKDHAKGVMDEHLGLIRAASRELKQRGVHKEEVDLEKRYRAYLSENTSENYAAVEHDLTTLRDFNHTS